MAGVSSLLKSAAAAQKKVQAAQDAYMAFNWENSAQTKDDFLEYSKYLQDRQTRANDSTDIISYATKLRGAQRSYVSNEIQRQTMAVMEGGSTLTDKQNTIRDLYYQAYAAGDYNLAQNLAGQYDSLSVQIQNESKAAFGQAVAAGQKATSKLINSIVKGTDNVTLPNGHIIKPFAAIGNILANGPGQKIQNATLVWAAAQDTLENLQQIVQAAYQNAPDQETADKILNDYGGYVDGSKKINIAGTELTAQDVFAAAQNEQFNNPLYHVESKYNQGTGQNDYKLIRNDAIDFQWVRQGSDPTTGEDLYVPLQVSKIPQDQGLGLDTQITNKGEIIGNNGKINLGTGTAKEDKTQSIQNRLNNLGIQVDKGSNGTVNITLPDGNVYNAVITPQGTVRFYGEPGTYSGNQPGLYEISLTDLNNFGIDPATGQPQNIKAGQIREVAPDETSIFGTPSNFGGNMSNASASGKRILGQYSTPDQLGQLKPIDLRNRGLNGISGPTLNGPISIGNDFTGRGVAVTSGLLQSANYTLQAKQQEQAAAAAAAARLQPANVFNLNQTPVQQYAQNGAPIRQLTVARPTPQPTIRVAPPAPTPRVTVTNNPNPYGQLGISGNLSGPLRVVSQ